ncbi:helix-turn-helix domain-containing protein [Candidatus Dojkabacteria bacterium]|uniref:Helix-turn-helix domain-containing protein n=1 Tax=Candidatus Dojkabacteria bacterium TaxID=2099670 RepID=A0A955L9T6_9BACT|nr:helix-turn-helix domain-containing protein [Candidatus Dojkabacteria bacterium]
MSNETCSKIEILDTTLKGGFSAMPRVVLRCSKLTMSAKTVYGLLLDYAWQDGECFPGQERLANDCGVHRNTIQKYLVELKEFGLITWKRRGLNKSNMYYILSIQDVFKNMPSKPPKTKDAHKAVHPDAQATVQQDAHETVQVLDSDYYKQNTYKQSLTINDQKNSFDKEAQEIAKELNDLKNIKFYQSVINKREKGDLTQGDIQEALNQTRKVMSESIQDGTGYLKNAGAWFTTCLKKLEKRRQEKSNLNKIKEMKNLLLSKSKMK